MKLKNTSPVAVAPQVESIHRPSRTNGNFAKFANFDYGSEHWSTGTKYAAGKTRETVNVTSLDVGMFLIISGALVGLVLLLVTLSEKRRRWNYRYGHKLFEQLDRRMV